MVQPCEAVEGEDEDGQWFRSFHVTYPQSMGVFQRDDGSILNVVVMADEDRSVWQLFSDPSQRAGGVGAEQAPLAEATLDRAYVPRFQLAGGDVLAHWRDPDTSVPTVVRLRVRPRRAP